MDNQRFFLFIALAFILFLLWGEWQKEYGSPAQTASVPAATTGGVAGPPDRTASSGQPLPAAADLPQAQSLPASAATSTPASGLKSAQRVRVTTDVLYIEIDTLGGDIRVADLLAYPVAADRPDQPTRIMSDAPAHLFVTQAGLLGDHLPNHYTLFSADKSEYRLNEGEDTLEVRLSWKGDDGIEVERLYRFKRGSYAIDLVQRVKNPTAGKASFNQYLRFLRSKPEKKTAYGMRSYIGAAIYSEEENYEKIDFDDLEEGRLNRSITGGWSAMLQHYFVSALVPPKDETNQYIGKAIGNNQYVLDVVSPTYQVEPGGSIELHDTLYIGPKLEDILAPLAKGLELTVDYGYLYFISEPLLWVLKWIHGLIGNWGWSIVILTILIKLAFYKLSETSYRSMANMRKVTPKMQAIKERYGHDKQRLNQAMMELYKKEKINPLGGCLPIFVQIPVFIALYWMLWESVEMRHAPWILWINDLSSADPYFVLPVLMGVSMFVQQKLNPAPPDPVQAKIMMALPSCSPSSSCSSPPVWCCTGW
jgi:YidC/Oxa1 family membrane protein insertase